ncbi:MAG TPA: hypothetical protein PKY51_05870 [Fimbriimonadaceae bacterium]|nr:hypothetical protein [Fimbriimonadaceae bacterium]
MERIEQAFIAKLVARTRQLVHHESTELREKLAKIQLALDVNRKRLDMLRLARTRLTDNAPVNKVDRLIQIREQASSYLEATRKWLIQSTRHALCLAHEPEGYASPNWYRDEKRESSSDATPTKKGVDPPIEYPFMEFSS